MSTERHESDPTEFGMGHVTVVPTNFRPPGDADDADGDGREG